MSHVVTFSRLTLSEEECHQHLTDTEVAPPARRGDVETAIERGAGVIVLIDGTFHQNRAVSPSELLDAIRCGVRVYGSSSMGALRAAELQRLGMLGHGRVFEHIRDTPGFRDDFVGQAIHPTSFKPMSMAYVDLMFGLRDDVDAGELRDDEAERLLEGAAKMHYAQRSLRAIQHLAKSLFDGERQAAVIQRLDLLGDRDRSQKRRDAISVLQRVRTDLETIRSLNERFARDTDDACSLELFYT